MNSKLRISRNALYILAFIFITIFSILYKTVLSGTVDKTIIVNSEIAESTQIVEDTTITESSIELISVYICGEVNNPGVYSIARGSIVNDVVTMAGGFTDSADRNHINLVYILDSNVSLYIPSENEDYSSEIVWGNNVDNEVSSNLININNSSLDVLMTLPGIGQATASAIIEYRESNPFTRIEDIMNVPGIGEAKFNAIRDFICV